MFRFPNSPDTWTLAQLAIAYDWHPVMDRGEVVAFARNKRIVRVVVNGEICRISEAARRLDLSKQAMWARVRSWQPGSLLVSPRTGDSKPPTRFTYRGVTRTFAEWAAITNIPEPTLRYRVKAGWDADIAFSRPTHRKQLLS